MVILLYYCLINEVLFIRNYYNYRYFFVQVPIIPLKVFVHLSPDWYSKNVPVIQFVIYCIFLCGGNRSEEGS